jgi:hypothetical protein
MLSALLTRAVSAVVENVRARIIREKQSRMLPRSQRNHLLNNMFAQSPAAGTSKPAADAEPDLIWTLRAGYLSRTAKGQHRPASSRATAGVGDHRAVGAFVEAFPAAIQAPVGGVTTSTGRRVVDTPASTQHHRRRVGCAVPTR